MISRKKDAFLALLQVQQAFYITWLLPLLNFNSCISMGSVGHKNTGGFLRNGPITEGSSSSADHQQTGAKKSTWLFACKGITMIMQQKKRLSGGGLKDDEADCA